MDTNLFVFDCNSCPFRCDGVSKMKYDFGSDVEFAERIEKYVSDQVKLSGLSCVKTVKDGYPDLEVYTSDGKFLCYIEVKAQRRTFMSVERILPEGNLKPSETLALNLSDLLRYFEILDETKKPVFILWALMNRPCIVPNEKVKLFYQNARRLKMVYEQYGDKRRFRRKSGSGDVVNGVHKGVVVNYHFSLNELRPFTVQDLLQSLSV